MKPEPITIIVVLQLMWLGGITATFIWCVALAFAKPHRIFSLFAMLMGFMFGLMYSEFARLFGLLPY